MTTRSASADNPAHTPTLIASLREIARALSAAWEVDATLDLIARKTAQVMAVDSCSIYLLEPGGATLWLRASTGLAPTALGRTSLEMGEGLTGWAAQKGLPVAERDARADPRFKFLPQTREQNYRSLLAVPLINRGRVIGAMNVQTREYHTFTEDEIELAALISDLAAGALDRALLYENMNRQISELSTLAKVSETVTSPLYLDEMLSLITEMAGKVMGTPVCSLLLLDPARALLTLRAAWGASAAYRQKPPLKEGEGIAGLVMRERKPMAITDVRAEPRYQARDLAEREGLASLLCVPLMVRDRSIGVLNCYTTQPHLFGEAEITLASTLANQTALAIENAQLVTNAAVVREMHHRIKNNLQTVAMLLRMQAADSADEATREALSVSINRILSIAAVHEALAQQGFQLVDVKDVAERIARSVAQNLLHPGQAVDIRVEGESLVLPSRPATSLALVVNELLQNALEHAFVGRPGGAVRIRLGHGPQADVVEVVDDGVGLAADAPASLGLEIVKTLVREDLRGGLEFRSTAEGTQVVVRLPHFAEKSESS
jgi:signal transduction protein with GAF and PtsI domain